MNVLLKLENVTEEEDKGRAGAVGGRGGGGMGDDGAGRRLHRKRGMMMMEQGSIIELGDDDRAGLTDQMDDDRAKGR